VRFPAKVGVMGMNVEDFEDGNESRIPDEDDAIIDKFGNNVEACLGQSKNHSTMLKLVNQLASMS